MPTYNIKRFAEPDSLKRMKEQHLLALLSPHNDYFTRRGVSLCSTNGSEFPYEALTNVLLNPDDAMPPQLVDALYYVNEMATPESMDELLDAAMAEGIALDSSAGMTPADVAAQVWIENRGLLERKHAEQFLRRPRSYESFQSREFPGLEPKCTREALAALESDLDTWFESKKRGCGCRIFVYPREQEIWFLVRHGQPFKREGSLKGGESTSVYYRPEKHDVLIYNQALSEMRMNAKSKGEKELYREKFGLHLFGFENYFPGTAKYTLTPLGEDSEAALVCNDIEGMEWVKLTEIRYYWGGTQHEIEIRRADDLLAALRQRGREITHGQRIVKAGFLVKFKDSKTPRSVAIRPDNIAEYTRDDDGALVEQWLAKRGFIRSEQLEEDEELETALAGA